MTKYIHIVIITIFRNPKTGNYVFKASMHREEKQSSDDVERFVLNQEVKVRKVECL